KVNPAYTSQDCSQCGHRVRKTLAKREHRCDKCGYVAHRDHNSALAIKGRAGLSGMVSDGKSREPRISTYSRQASVESVNFLLCGACGAQGHSPKSRALL